MLCRDPLEPTSLFKRPQSSVSLIVAALVALATICLARESFAAQAVYSDGRINLALPENTIALEKQKCGREIVAKIPSGLTNFRCYKFGNAGAEYALLESTERSGKRRWDYKLLRLAESAQEVGELSADYTVIPLLAEGGRMEFLAVSMNSTREPASTRYQFNESRSPALSVVSGRAVVKSRSPSSQSWLPKLAPIQPAAQREVAESRTTDDAVFTPIIRSSAQAPAGAPPNDVIEKAVRKKLQNSVPEPWVEYGKPGVETKFREIEIVKWGPYKKEGAYFPVRVRIAGEAVVYDLMFRPERRRFDQVGEFRFSKNDFDEWESWFLRPGMFGSKKWTQ